MKQALIQAIIEAVTLSVAVTIFLAMGQKVFSLSNEKTAFFAVILMFGFIFWLNKRFSKLTNG